MSSIITHVILPGLGPVCPECFSRGHIGPPFLAPGEVYSFGITEPQAQLDWDVVAARALIDDQPDMRVVAEPISAGSDSW